MKRLLLIPLLALATLGQSVDIVQSNELVQQRKWLDKAILSYAIQSETNVVVTQIVLNIRVEQKLGENNWVRTSVQPITFSRESATQWVLSYTNNSGVVVTNNIRNAALLDCDRAEILVSRAVQFLKTPQAMTPQPPQPE